MLFLLLLLATPARAIEIPLPLHACVAPTYTIRIFPTDTSSGRRIEIRGADMSRLNLAMRSLVQTRDRLHFPSGKPRFECASISPDGSDYYETIKVYDGFVQVQKGTPRGALSPVQYELLE